MAHIWQRDNENWVVSPLTAAAYRLAGVGLARAENLGREDCPEEPAMVVCSSPGSEEEWAVVGNETSVAVNGSPLAVGIRVLRDRDEILVRDGGAGTRRFFFSCERLARVEPFPATNGAARCPRCKQPLNEGDMAVQCPGCGARHHQSEAYPCWTYAKRCALCDYTTELGAGFRWSPEEI